MDTDYVDTKFKQLEILLYFIDRKLRYTTALLLSFVKGLFCEGCFYIHLVKLASNARRNGQQKRYVDELTAYNVTEFCGYRHIKCINI